MRLNLLRDMLASGGVTLIGAFNGAHFSSPSFKRQNVRKVAPLNANPPGFNESIYYPARMDGEKGNASDNRTAVAESACMRTCTSVGARIEGGAH